MKILIKNIKSLVQVRETAHTIVSGANMRLLPCLADAWLAIEDGLITGFGPMDEWEGISDWTGLEVIDATNKLVMPSWCDSHTHIVYAGTREGEFIDRIKGLSYAEIANKGGGILNSAKRLRETSEEDLVEQAMRRMTEIMHQGTGAVEIKSGYGLSVESELKMLRVIRTLKTLTPLTIRATFLGAHAVPLEYAGKKPAYIDLLIHELMPRIAEEKLADYCDVFCEDKYFTPDETRRILEAGKAHGLVPKVHAEQMSNYGGVLAGVACGAISVDHLEYVSEREIQALLKSTTMPTILPGAAFFLSLPHPPARQMIDAGLPLAIASDFNPGSSPSGNINLMLAIACIQYKMTPEEAINAATLNSAFAMGLNHSHGSIAIGKKANVFITREIPGYGFIPYSFGSNFVETVILNGQCIKK
jgi:imidazolonepropionase